MNILSENLRRTIRAWLRAQTHLKFRHESELDMSDGHWPLTDQDISNLSAHIGEILFREDKIRQKLSNINLSRAALTTQLMRLTEEEAVLQKQCPHLFGGQSVAVKLGMGVGYTCTTCGGEINE